MDPTEQTHTPIPIFKGLVAGLIGFIIGLVFGGGAFLQQGYLNESFSNTLLVISLPLQYFIFRGLKFKYAFLYPIVLALIGDNLQQTEAFRWVNNVVSYGSASTTRLTTAIMVAAIFLVIAYFIESISALRTMLNNVPRAMACIVLALLPLLLFGLFISSGTKLQAARVRQLASFSHPTLEGVLLQHVDKQIYTVSYLNSDGSPITYPSRDTLLNSVRIVNSPKTDTMYIDTYHHYKFQTTCNNARLPGGTQSSPYKINTIGNTGFKYGYAAFQQNASNPPRPEEAYTTQYYCFVVNGDRYVFTRDDRNSGEQIKLYPAEGIIKSILGAKQRP